MDDDNQCRPSGIESSTSLLSEQGRLNTFRSWPQGNVIEPAALAGAGFYYCGQEDRVRCAFCERSLSSWQPGDDPLQEHRKHFGDCDFVQGRNVGNIPLSASNSKPPGQLAQSNPMTRGGPEGSIGAVLLKPLFPNYQSMSSRQRSFDSGWPSNKNQQPQALAEAGFFYIGHDDAVQCFCCGLALRGWETEDIPWVEHTRYLSRCPYVLQQKGVDFVRTVCREHTRSPETQSIDVPPPVCSLTTTSGVLPTEDPLMSSELVKQVLLMGFDRIHVHNILQQQFISRGREPQIDELLGFLLNEDTGVSQSLAPAAVVSDPCEAVGREGERRSASDRMLCKVCMDNEVAITFQPCGHLVCCTNCAVRVKQCPMCRRIIRANIRTYLC